MLIKFMNVKITIHVYIKKAVKTFVLTASAPRAGLEPATGWLQVP